jgi:hypothetical protein
MGVRIPLPFLACFKALHTYITERIFFCDGHENEELYRDPLTVTPLLNLAYQAHVGLECRIVLPSAACEASTQSPD